ncbi:hypothetical protein [Clostridium senegalense]|uniref:Uncharacterized protein n=1 Tax=Clostridium senegalense TaxID=1465809 RepID=A0A6M0H9I7_9CLOT|nr:hypothetical protein [Clostridium senegalense]NEU06551.1 hypothetical protein [Clostridium senegalense]
MCLYNRAKDLNLFYKELWWKSNCNLCLDIDYIDYFDKKRNEKEFNLFLDAFLNNIMEHPKDDEEKFNLKNRCTKNIKDFLSKVDFYNAKYIENHIDEKFFESTKFFIENCKSFDDKLTFEDIGQAMRNLWIVNILQKAFGYNVQFTKAIFGYSMLYPYTDNYLDNPSISIEEKSDFNKRFLKRLEGEKLNGNCDHENKVYKLIEEIEKVFKREDNEKVYESLVIILNAQQHGLINQSEKSIPYENDILGISIEKGGASVLADGYLINGALNESQEEFVYGYGFLLQLCDDIQDIEEDLKNNHMTIISQIAGKYPLDLIVNKLINFTCEFLDASECFNCEKEDELKYIIKTNCLMMIFFAIVKNRKYFSKEYVKEIKKYVPFTNRFIDKLEINTKKKVKKLKEDLNVDKY